MLALTASIKYKAASIGEIAKQHLSRNTHILFLIFIWLALLYVIIAFTDITAQTFCAVSQDTAYGPAVAASSIIYLGSGDCHGYPTMPVQTQVMAADGDFSSSGFIGRMGWSICPHISSLY